MRRQRLAIVVPCDFGAALHAGQDSMAQDAPNAASPNNDEPTKVPTNRVLLTCRLHVTQALQSLILVAQAWDLQRGRT